MTLPLYFSGKLADAILMAEMKHYYEADSEHPAYTQAYIQNRENCIGNRTHKQSSISTNKISNSR
jgi:hypothetical protein